MKVKLLSHTRRMYKTINQVWQASRSNEPIEMLSNNHSGNRDLFFRILEEDIPIAEMIDFVFLLEDIPISLREQLVRHRIGVKVDGRIGMDIVPELSDSSFWSQSMRVLDMCDFNFFIPESIAESHMIMGIYETAMRTANKAYKQLVDNGVPKEDARNVIPLGATHRIVWKLNLAALKHVLRKRGCWILQLGLWKPIIEGIVHELAEIDPRFRVLISPPCIKNNKFTACSFCENNKERIIGEVDGLPPCPLYLRQHESEAEKIASSVFAESKRSWYHVTGTRIPNWACFNESQQPIMNKMRNEYRLLWGRNVDTGESI